MLGRAFARIFGRNTSERRSFEAAGGGRRWKDARRITNLNQNILGSAATVRQRGQFHVRNNPWLSAGIGSLVSNLVGTGIKPQSEHPDPDMRARLHGLWARWTDEADADGLTDFYGLQAVAVRSMLEGGEAFGRLRPRRPSDGLEVPLQIEGLDAEQVPIGLTQEIGGNARITAGIEFSPIGRRVAYHVYRRRPGDLTGPVSLETVRVPALDMLHLFEPLTFGQVRGISRLAPVLLRLHELDAFEDATLVRQKVATLFTGFIEDESRAAGLTDGATTDGVAEAGLEPGTMIVLPSGAKITFPDVPDPGPYADYTKAHLRAIAMGLGVTEYQLSGDLRGANYSSLRAGLVEFRRAAEQLQHGVIVYQFCRPVWRRFVTMAVLSGALPARDFERNPTPYLAARWIAPGWDWVDPLKDAQAQVLALDNLLKSRSEAISERGLDPEQVDAEIAADQERANTLGIAVRAAAAAIAAATEDSRDPEEEESHDAA